MKKIHLELGIEEVNTILEALGALPFARVYTLIGRIQEHARAQIVDDEAHEPHGPNGGDRGHGG